jgi:hypothetical protein
MGCLVRVILLFRYQTGWRKIKEYAKKIPISDNIGYWLWGFFAFLIFEFFCGI